RRTGSRPARLFSAACNASAASARWEVFFARTGTAPLRAAYEDMVQDPGRGGAGPERARRPRSAGRYLRRARRTSAQATLSILAQGKRLAPAWRIESRDTAGY